MTWRRLDACLGSLAHAGISGCSVGLLLFEEMYSSDSQASRNGRYAPVIVEPVSSIFVQNASETAAKGRPYNKTLSSESRRETVLLSRTATRPFEGDPYSNHHYG